MMLSLQERHVFEHPRPKKPKSLRIYESHVGMSSKVCFSSLKCYKLALSFIRRLIWCLFLLVMNNLAIFSILLVEISILWLVDARNEELYEYQMKYSCRVGMNRLTKVE